MNILTTILILGAVFLAVFWEASFDLVRQWVRAQVDLLPPLIVYTSLYAEFRTLCLVAVLGGLLFDSLSANPLGVTVLPLFLTGLAVYARRDLLLRDQPFAQFILGLSASAMVPVLTLILLLTTGYSPLVGWGTVWQVIVMALGGGIATPVIFLVFEWLQRALVHRPESQPSFRPDREIRRGR
jgi:cell shape-determining protein MreD